MHVGSVLVCEGSMKFEDFRDMLASRIHLVPRMMQRLVMVPLGLGKPYWIDDPDFDLDLHMQHVALPRPGDWRGLRKLAARTFSVLLDRRRPLWEMVFVEGLDNIPQVPAGSVGLISRVHHAAIDGVSGADMMSILFDITREPREVDPAPARTRSRVPNELQVIAQTARHIVRKPLALPALLQGSLKAMRAGNASRVQGLEPPPMPFTAPATPLNQLVSSKRVWNTALLELDRVKAIKNALGCTLNDVVLAICAGALRRYLLEKNALPDEPLVSMVPISTRSKDGHGAMGNQVSAMLVQLATDVSDPIERVKAIHSNAQRGKAYQDAIGADTLSSFTDFVPFGLAGGAARLYSRFKVAARHKPLFNLVITNVPGPQVDLYVARHKLLATMGMAPIIDGMGLIITVLSYNGVLSLSPTSSAAVMPDIDDFSRMLREEANTLEAAVLAAHPTPASDEPSAEVVEKTATDFFAHMQNHLDQRGAADASGTFQFRIIGASESNWIVALEELSVARGETEDADATLSIKGKHLASILAGRLDPQLAVVQGKLRVSGDISKALAFGAILPEVIKEARAASV